MWRKITLGLLSLTAVHAAAQEPASGRTIFRVGGGVGTSDYTCAGCQIDAQTGFSGLLAANRTIGGVLTAGVEGTLSHTTGNHADATLVGALATLGARGRSRAPLWGMAGLGWLWYSGVGPSSSGPAFSARAGMDLPVGPRLAVSPFAGFLTMVGHDGPRVLTGSTIDPNDPGVRTRLSSLQIGAVLTFTP